MLKVLFLVLRQMHDTGHARHTHERGDRYFSKHFKGYACCWRRLPTSQVFAPEYHRSTSSVWSITLSVLQSGERSVSWVSALQLRSTALPCVTIVAAYSMAGRVSSETSRFLSRSRATCQEANDVGCDRAPVLLGLLTFVARTRSVFQWCSLFCFFFPLFSH